MNGAHHRGGRDNYRNGSADHSRERSLHAGPSNGLQHNAPTAHVAATHSQPAAHRPLLGILEWFRPGEHDRVEQMLSDTRALGIQHLRTGISWADWYSSGAEEWYDWLFPRLASELDLLPCFVYTPPSLGVAPKTSSPPRDPKHYADWLDVMITRYGKHFEWVELWNEPNNGREWDETLDPGWWRFCEMIGGAAYWARQRGKKTLLGGMSPIDPNWLHMVFQRGVMSYIDAVGIHGFPVTFEFWWDGWAASVARVREVIDGWGSSAGIWLTETGYSTFRHDERRQLGMFVDALDSPVDRLYWYAGQDLDPALPTVDGFHSDEREYHFGLKRADGTPKLLYRLLAGGGPEAAHEAVWLAEPATLPRRGEGAALITGGAGFIGTNLANRLLEQGRPVVLLDNLSRPGVERNLQWLRETHGDRVQIEVADVRDPHTLSHVVRHVDQVFHFAAQVAVTTSLVNPVEDFEVNARGTLNLLEALRACSNPPSLVFTSTNKVYGALDDVALHLDGVRYEPLDPLIRASGIGEDRSLDFHSPYGCSKGAADQYVVDYARVYGLPTVVFRMSCIYGPHQFGNEDQGWVAHFLIRALDRQPISLYGDGMQVRDILFVEDLVDAFLLAQENIHRLAGKAFNIGGGPANTISLLELLELIRHLEGRKPQVSFEDWRPGDQRYYVTDTSKFRAATGWQPRFSAVEGIQRLYEWLLSTRGIHRRARPLPSGLKTAAAGVPVPTGKRG